MSTSNGNPIPMFTPINDWQFRLLLNDFTTVAGQTDLLHPWLEKDPIRAYCDIVWLCTYTSQRVEFFSRIANEIRLSIEENIGCLEIKEEDKKIFSDWWRKYENDVQIWAAKRDNIQACRKTHFEKYQAYQQSNGLKFFEPTYTIDPRDAEIRLILQRIYDIERDVRHMSANELSDLEIVKFQSQGPGRRFYLKSPLLEQKPLATIQAECYNLLTRIPNCGEAKDDGSFAPYMRPFQEIYRDDELNYWAHNWLPLKIRNLHSRLNVMKERQEDLLAGKLQYTDLLAVKPEYGCNGLRTNHREWADSQYALHFFPVEMKAFAKEKNLPTIYESWFDLDATAESRALKADAARYLDLFLEVWTSSRTEEESAIPPKVPEVRHDSDTKTQDSEMDEEEEISDEEEEEEWEEYEPPASPEPEGPQSDEPPTPFDPYVFPGGKLAENYTNMWFRAEPYAPTPQNDNLRFKKERGNVPAGLKLPIVNGKPEAFTAEDWVNVFNQANSEVYTENGGHSGDLSDRKKANAAMKLGRKSGYTRDRALWILQKRGYITKDYMDLEC